MAHKFEPLQNDLIIRTAWGETGVVYLGKKCIVNSPRPESRKSSHVGYASRYDSILQYFGIIYLMLHTAGRYLPEYHEAKGKHDFFETCRSPEIASTLTLQPIDRYAGLVDAAIIFSDILVVPQALGMTVEMVNKKGPHFPQPLKSPDDEQYKQVLSKRVDVAAELDYVYKAITMTRHKLKGRVPLFGFCGAPWTLLCYMVEGGGSKIFKEVKTWIYKYPQACKELLQKIAEVCVEYLALQVQAGAQVRKSPSLVLRITNACKAHPGLRFVGRRTITIFLSRIFSAIPRIYFRTSPETIRGVEAGACTNGDLCKRCLVRTRCFM